MLHKSEQTQWGEPRTTENRRDYWNNYSLAVCLRAPCFLTCLGLFTSLWEDSDVLLRIKCLITAIYVILKDKALPQRINYRWPGASSLTLNSPPHLQQQLKIDPWNHFWPGLNYFLLKQEIYLYINKKSGGGRDVNASASDTVCPKSISYFSTYNFLSISTMMVNKIIIK